MTDLKKYLPPVMRTRYWNSLMDSIEETINEIQSEELGVIKEPFSISESTREELIEIASSIFALDKLMLNNLLDFLIEQEISINGFSQEQAEARALERLRQEISKIPYSIGKRGTLQFYGSIFNFCDYTYKGALTIVKTDLEVRVSQIIPNFAFELHDSNELKFYAPTPANDFSGVEEIVYQTLDQEIEGEEDKYSTLDGEITVSGYVPTLDMVTRYTELVYRKMVFLGLLMTDTEFMYFSDFNKNIVGPSFPEELGRYYLSFLKLNKRATDILVFGPMVALNIPSSITGSNDNLVSDYRLSVTRSNVKTSSFDYFEIDYYDDPESLEAFYYDESPNQKKIDPSTLTSGGAVIMGLCQGEKVKKYCSPINSATEQKVEFEIPEEDFGTSFVLRIYEDGINNEGVNIQFLFYRNEYDAMILRYASLDVTPVCVVTRSNGKVKFSISIPETDTDFKNINRATYMYDKAHTEIRRIDVIGRKTTDTSRTEIARLKLISGSQIELCKNLTFSVLLSIHDSE